MITIIGAGRNKFDFTLAGVDAINNSDIVVLKTTLTPTYEYFLDNNIKVESLDCCYEKAENFTDLDNLIVEYFSQLVTKYDNIAFVVNGVGYDDSSVIKLVNNFDTRIIAGVSDSASLLELNPSCDYTILSGHYFVDKQVINLNKRIPLIVKEIDNKNLASIIKLWLARLYGDEQQIILINDGNVEQVELFELDRKANYSYDTMLLIEPSKLVDRRAYDFSDLLEIMYILRSENGCKWDKAQTHKSIRGNMIEEAYELCDAIDNEDIINMIEEAGDVMLQTVFHSVIGEQTGEFDIYEVLFGLCDKLLSRHTHIFGEDKVDNPEDALLVWEKNKNKEKHHDTYSSAVNDVPKCYPALIRASKVCKRVGKGGWEIGSIDEIFEKISEETEELKQAIISQDNASIMEEIGDLLLAITELSRKVGVDSEQSLYNATIKLQQRFTEFEKLVINDNKDMLNLTKQEADSYYLKAKEITKQC